ncbi:MAG: MBL fold metallo-hydrolase [Lachnospiraceae bacterium]|nr:MBL fold metallo-hydrolase [Lachnospiraceae bacterium]
MRFKVDVLFPGFTGKMAKGRLGWGTLALVRDGVHNILMDAGGPVVRVFVKEMLAEHGLTCEDIDYVIISHGHADHVYNIDFFPQAKIVISKTEWEHMNDFENRDYSTAECAIPWLRAYRKQFVTQDGEEIVPGMTSLLTPGHTPGSLSVLLDQGEGVTWALVGDAVKNRAELRSEYVLQTCDAQASHESIVRIKGLATRILPGHDGWLTLNNGEVIPEGGNDVTLIYPEGITVNGGNHEITLHID